MFIRIDGFLVSQREKPATESFDVRFTNVPGKMCCRHGSDAKKIKKQRHNRWRSRTKIRSENMSASQWQFSCAFAIDRRSPDAKNVNIYFRHK